MTTHSTNASQSTTEGALLPIVILFGGIFLLLIGMFALRPGAVQTTPVPAQAESGAVEATSAPQLVLATATPQTVALLDPAMVSRGSNLFQATCAACHGFNAMGISGLGKTLIGSEYINSISDDELLSFINVGRQVFDPLNTTGVMMPPKGGNPTLTDDDLRAVIAYIRSLNTGDAAAPAVASNPTPAVSPTPAPTIEFKPLDLSGLQVGAGVQTSGGAFGALPGQQGYVQSCTGCHGVSGEGVYLLAGPLAESELLKRRDGMGLLGFLTDSHPPVNPEVAYPHPYRGGYPELSDQQIQEIITYLYTLIPVF
jgi:disulfide bond formation protein DsbB